MQVRALFQKYQVVFSPREGDLCCTHLISHDIPLLDDVPVKQRYLRIPLSDYEVVKTHINQLLEVQVIMESSCPNASPIVLVKKDGSLHMCIHYHYLNAMTRKDSFPLPRIEESLDSLTGAGQLHWILPVDIIKSLLWKS